MYHRFLGPTIDEEHALDTMRKAAVQEAGPAIARGNERDKRFAGLIVQQIGSNQNSWAIAIVGKNHASNTDGSIATVVGRASVHVRGNRSFDRLTLLTPMPLVFQYGSCSAQIQR